MDKLGQQDQSAHDVDYKGRLTMQDRTMATRLRPTIRPSVQPQLEELQQLLGHEDVSETVNHVLTVYLSKEIKVQKQLKEEAEKLRGG